MTDGTITDPGRITASVPTLKALLDAGAKVVVTAHLGRPKDGPDPKLSLAPVAAALGEQLGRHVQLAGDVVGTDALARAEGLTDGDILLLENIRFDPRETSKDDGRATGPGQAAGRIGLAGRRFRLRRLRGGAPQAGLGVRRRHPAAALRRHAGRRRDQGARAADQLDQTPLRGGARRVEGVRQARRHRVAGDQGRQHRHRRRHVLHFPCRAGSFGRQVAAGRTR